MQLGLGIKWDNICKIYYWNNYIWKQMSDKYFLPTSQLQLNTLTHLISSLHKSHLWDIDLDTKNEQLQH